MKKPLARNAKAPLARTVPLAKGDRPKLLRSRPLLGFVQDEPNPLEGVVPDPKQPMKKELDAVGLAFRAASKSIKGDQMHEHAGYGAEYFVVVCQDAGQCTALLKGMGYPEPKDVYVDGLVVAELLNIKLPDAQVQPKKLKAIHNPKLTRLARPL